MLFGRDDYDWIVVFDHGLSENLSEKLWGMAKAVPLKFGCKQSLGVVYSDQHTGYTLKVKWFE